MKRHFDNLGLPQTATVGEVKRAYRKLALQLHPDKNTNPKAVNLFFELQESYSFLLHFLSVEETNIHDKPSEIRKKKTKEQRIQEAKKRYNEQIKREQQVTDNYFNSLTNGLRWKIYKTGSILCTVIVLLVSIDLLLPKHFEKDEFSGWSNTKSGGVIMDFVHPVYLKNAGQFFIEDGFFNILNSYPNIYIRKTQIFQIPIQLIHPVDDDIKIYDLDWCFYALLPFPLLLFLIPPILLFYRKKTPNFSFTYFFSLYVVFPIAILFLLFDFRWLHLLTLGIF